MLEFKDEVDKEVPQDDSSTFEEKLLLYSLIRSIKPKVVVETGTHRGKTTLYLAQALEDNGEGHVYTYDPYEWGAEGNFNKFPELKKRITYKQIPGNQVSEEEIDFVFVDGFHEAEIVREEIKVLLPRLSKNGVMVFHDCFYEKEEAETVNLACEQAGLKTVWIPTFNCIRIYSHVH